MGLTSSVAKETSSTNSLRENDWNFSLFTPTSWSRRKFKEKINCWVQLAGHEGSLIPDGKGGVLKRYNECEARCLFELQHDVLNSYVPKYHGQTIINGIRYVRMQDLLHDFYSPSVMDCKMGQRTYLENEVIGPSSSENLRPDMYLKMVAINPEAPTPKEHCERSVSKLRYMQWRETLSSSASFGFRVEAIRNADGLINRNFKQTRSWSELKIYFRDFVQSSPLITENYLIRLRNLLETLERSRFFATHEFIGSSLLFVHDATGSANIWMIDFGKTISITNEVTTTSSGDGNNKINGRLNHRSVWELGNHEEGYLIGMDNLIALFEQLLSELG